MRPAKNKRVLCAGLIFLLSCLPSCSDFNHKKTTMTKSDGVRNPSAEVSFIPAEMVYSRHAFLGWRSDSQTTSSSIDPTKLAPKTIACEDKNLYPTHPMMDRKLYHLGYTGQYDYWRLQRDEPGCLVGGMSKVKGVFPCLSSDRLQHVIISDTYQDRCGNYYRGFSQQVYLKKEENMATLFSRGRTMYLNHQSPFANDYLIGETYSVDSKSLMLVSDLFEGDLSAIRSGREAALKSDFVFNGQSLLFTLKNPQR